MIIQTMTRLGAAAGVIWALVAGSVQAGSPVADASLGAWLERQSQYSTRAVLGNILPSGAVIASTSIQPDYRFHWIRDAALAMETVIGLYERTKDPAQKQRYLHTLLEYAEFSRRNQLTPNRSGPADGGGLGEPKFMLDGSEFAADWGRPQNDGPALRAAVLIRLSWILLGQGQEALVRQKLYDARLPARTVIKADLEYVAHRWRDSNVDLWEEVDGKHFYTSMVHRRALIEGARIADRLGDPGAAGFYRSQLAALEERIQSHWDGAKGIIQVTLPRYRALDNRRAPKTSGLDVAVVLGALHGAVATGNPAVDGFFGVTDERILSTAFQIDQVFRKIYPINSSSVDSSGAPLGAAIGRYPEDEYSGEVDSNVGSPWFLATTAFAELCYKAADALEKQGSLRVTEVNKRWLQSLPGQPRVRAGERLARGVDARFDRILRGMREQGDAYLRRVRMHGDPGGGLSEQFNRDTGAMQSAEELTWSHASVLTTAWAR